MYRMNVWTCVHVSVHIQSWCEIMLLLKPAGPWFSLWGLTVPSGQEEENVFFAGTQCCSVWLTMWGRPWPAVQVESLGSWIHVHQCTLILYIAACTQRREHNSSLLLSYGCTLHLYSFREIYVNNFTYLINAFGCWSRSRSFVHLPVPFMLLFSAAR